MIIKTPNRPDLVECDECHETAYACQSMPNNAIDEGWYHDIETRHGIRIDLCRDCGFKLTDDHCNLPDHEADRIIKANQP